MISTLYKFPWAATQTYTVAARDAIFEATYKQLKVLSKKVDVTNQNYNTTIVPYNNNQAYNQAYPPLGNGYTPSSFQNGPVPIQREVGLSHTLLMDLLLAAMNVPAFSLSQKSALCQVAGSAGRGIPLTHLAQNWPFQTLAPRGNTDKAVTEFWIQIFDSGFDLISEEGTETTYEHYISFSRNMNNYPVAEWKFAGLELPFEDGIRVEMAAMMVYVNRGRDEWAYERGLTVSKWEPARLIDLMESIAREKEAGRHFEAGEPKICSQADRSISPTGTEFTSQSLAFTDSIRNTAATGPSANSVLGSGTRTQDTTPKLNPTSTSNSASTLNPATAKEFVPVAARRGSLFEPATNNPYVAFKSIWSDPPIGPAQPSRAKLIIDRNAGNKIVTRGSISQDVRPDPRISAPRTNVGFRNPFGPPTNETRGFQREDPRPDYLHSEKDGPKSTFNPFENRNRQSSTRAIEPTAWGEQMRQLSLAAAGASRNNSNDTAYVSTTTSNEPGPTNIEAWSDRYSSFAAGEGGSPTPKRVQIQKYPNVTYSNIRPGPNQSNISFGQFNSQTHAQSQVDVGVIAHPASTPSQAHTHPNPEAGVIGDQPRIRAGPPRLGSPFSPKVKANANDKLRAQSSPSTGYQYGQSSAFLRPPPGLEKRPSLPVNVTGVVNLPLGLGVARGLTPMRPQPRARARGGTVTEFEDGGVDDNGGVNLDGRGNGGRLSASELWKGLGG